MMDESVNVALEMVGRGLSGVSGSAVRSANNIVEHERSACGLKRRRVGLYTSMSSLQGSP